MEWVSDHQTGIYVTLIVHLVLAIGLMIVKIGALPEPRHVQILMDFSQQEKQQMEQKHLNSKEEALDRAREALASASGVRNIAVDASVKAKPRDKVMDEADELQRKLEATKKMQAQAEQELSELGRISANKAMQASVSAAAKNASESAPFIGNAVISWILAGRKAIYLPNPVYTCEKGGEVEVMIVVNKRGYVDEVSVSKRAAAPSPCLFEAAMRAAKQSRFTSGPQDKQAGYIKYRFISQ